MDATLIISIVVAAVFVSLLALKGFSTAQSNNSQTPENPGILAKDPEPAETSANLNSSGGDAETIAVIESAMTVYLGKLPGNLTITRVDSANVA